MRIENEKYILEVSTKAAEITSFKCKETNIEYIWNGNPEFWKNRNPILWPVISSSYDKKYHFGDLTTEMGNHGICRYAEFKEGEVTDDSITVYLEDSEETLKQFPFKFKLEVTYKLEDNKVTVFYRIYNKDSKALPFAFGLHPAFNCPLEEGKKFSDYYVEFDSEVIAVGEGPFESGKPVKKFRLDYTDFEKWPTFSISKCISPYVSYTDGKHGVKLSNVGYNQFCVWTPKKDCPFVCLEPWQPTDNYVDEPIEFEKRDARFVIEPNKFYMTCYTIEVM